MKKQFYLYNTLTRKIEKFEPLHPPVVSYYTCGPTVYDYTHLGHIRTYLNNDLLKRALIFNGYQVKHVMNITDVGHLTSDADEGEDKMEIGAKRMKKTVWEVAEYFTNHFFKTIEQLNILLPDIVAKATDHIQEMIELIKILEKKGYTYQTDQAVYFDVSKFKNYGQLSGQRLEEKISGAREEVYLDPNKKHPADFVLWFKRVGRFKNHIMHWSSPWGEGFPGWHIECSAMAMKYLGETIDIHAGGVDHIQIHHTNEIAQSEASTGKQFVRFWFHNEFLTIEGKKMSKSLKNIYTLEDVKKHNIEPLALRYLFIQAHYRQPMNFTWLSAQSAQEGYLHLKELISELKTAQPISKLSPTAESFLEKFQEYINYDLQVPKAFALMWEVLKSNSLKEEEKLKLVLEFDKVFGLKLDQIEPLKIPAEIKKLAEERLKLRKQKKFDLADELRKKIEEKGFLIEDKKDGYKLKRKIS